MAAYYLDTSALVKRYVVEVGRHLRGYDAVHLGAAIELQAGRDLQQLPALTFVSADREQLQAGRTERLQTEDPNTHP